MSLLSEFKQYCQEFDIKPLRQRGQNFLINEGVYLDVIAAADVEKGDTVLEIGPGLGHLTELLAQQAKQVLAVEIDRKLCEVLKNKFSQQKNIKIIQEDILKIDITKFKFSNYKIVANLPYNITGAALRKFLSGSKKPSSITLMLQKEVAQRIISKEPENSLLSLAVNFYGQPKIIKMVSKNNFWPSPKVDSAIIKISGIKKNRSINEEKFFNLLRSGFTSPRKYLISNLVRKNIFSRTNGEEMFLKINLSKTVRPQELSLQTWINLYQHIYGR